MTDSRFIAGEIVRMRNNHSCVGTIAGETLEKAGRLYWAVQLADASGTRMLPAAQLERVPGIINPLEELRSGHFGDPAVFRRLLIHHRLTGRLRDVIYSMDVTDTEFHAYQFKPVIKLLSSPSQGLLIADEVGLGKTIEAGLIWTELVARYDASRLLVICPKSLTEKWRQELWQKFSVDAKIVDAADLHHYLARETEGTDGFALISSLSSVRPDRDWEDSEKESSRTKLMRFLDEWQSEDYLLDCVIFDEAHHLRNENTSSHAFAARIMEIADYKLLLSATPINLGSEDLQNLLRLLDRESFDDRTIFREVARENEPLVAAREATLKPATTFRELSQMIEEIERGTMLKIDRQLDNLLEEIRSPDLEDSPLLRNRIAAQLEEMSLLGSIVNRTRRRDVNDLKVERRVTHHRWTMTSGERGVYDFLSEIVRRHAWTLDTNERFLLATPQRLIASSLPAACAHWAAAPEDLSIDDPDEEGEIASSLVSKLSEGCRDPDLIAELERGDTKFDCLLRTLRQHWSRDPDEKLIIFSSFRITIDYLSRRLRSEGIDLEVMHGGIKEPRASILARFEEKGKGGVLLTSEVGGEGLDMQFCRSLINYDLPWNPMKVEQRIGRIDRIGQLAEVINVVSLISGDTIEEQIYTRLYGRLLEIEKHLGAFETILGKEIHDLEQRLLDPSLSEKEREEEIERRAMAIEQRHLIESTLEEEAPGLIAHGDMILDRIEENHRPERQIGGDELADYLHEALAKRYPGSRINSVPGEPDLAEIVLSAEAHLAFRQMLTRSNRARTRLNREPRILAAFTRRPNLPKKIERISAVHPLVRFAAEIRKEAGRGVALQPVVQTSIVGNPVPAVPPGRYVAAVQKWFVDGAVRVDRLAFGAIDEHNRVLDVSDAERLMQSALKHGRQSAAKMDLGRLADRAEKLLADDLSKRFDRFVDEEAARHEDRVATGLARIDRQRATKVRDLQDRIDNWKYGGNPKKLKLIPAQEGKLRKLEAALNAKAEDLLEDRDRFSFQQDLIGLAVIEVGEVK